MHKTNFNNFLNQNLNSCQLEAVQKNEGSVLIIAGAGSGKTRVITARIANLILNDNELPNSILALTFTNKAAGEMKERIHSWLGLQAELPFLGTFHSFCLKLLKSNSNLLEISQFQIMDDEDQLKIIQNIIKKFSLDKKINARQIQYNISTLKNNFALESNIEFGQNKLIQEIYLNYEQERKSSKCFDFDDLIIETVKLFKKNKDFKKKFQSQIKHILVDEYQDTSSIQHELLKQLSKDDNNNLAVKSLCVVGDEDQSIYSWRGATVENIVHFTKDFKNTSIIKIEQNYRSVQPILETANFVISNNKNRNPKKLWSEKSAKNRVLQLACQSEYKEGDLIGQAIKSAEKIKPNCSIAILYRTHYQSRAIEESLIKSSIAYKIIGGIQFYERKEIKDLIAYLRLCVNPFDRVSFFRVINCPSRKLGEKFEEEFYNIWANESFLDFKEVSKKIINENKLTKTKQESLEQFVSIFDKLNSNETVKAINHIINEINYIAYLKENFENQEADTKIENVKEFLRAAFHFQEQGIGTISEFLNEIVLMQQKITQNNEKESNVQLMTLHAAKGLEFDIVIIAGLEESVLPSKKALGLEDDIEEERRLFYVGITRAKEYLIISNVKYRNSFGSTNVQIPSRFLEELPKNLVQREDTANYFGASQSVFLFNQFFNNKQVSNNIVTFGKESTLESINLSKKIEQQTSSWKLNQPIKHDQFGLGIIQKIEHKENGKTFITAKFNIGVKKLDSSFIKVI